MRTRAAAAAAAHQTEDDDAPEEVSLASGRETAQLQRQEESRAAKEKRRAAKERRRKAAEPPAEQAVTSAGAAAAQGLPTEGSDREAGGAAGASRGAEEQLDLLPEHVLEALARERRECALAERTSSGCEGLEPAGAARPKKRARRTHRQAGPVMVEVLSSSSDTKPSGSALDFARQRMAGVARSKEMLAPLSVAGVRVYAPASQFARQ